MYLHRMGSNGHFRTGSTNDRRVVKMKLFSRRWKSGSVNDQHLESSKMMTTEYVRSAKPGKGKRPLYLWSYFVIAMAFALSLGVSAEAENGKPFTKADYDQFETDYIAAAFGGDYVQLTKFNSVTPLNLSIDCDASVRERCLATLSLFKYSVSQSELLRVIVTKTQGEIHLVMADKDRLPALRAEFEKLFHKGTFDSSSADCQLYVSMAGAVITNAVIVISVDTEPLRAQTCFVVNFARSLGLALNDGKSFADAWGSESDPKTGFTSDDYEELKYRINVLLLVHACKRLRPGMTKREVEHELNLDSECLKRLEIISNG